MTLPSTMRRAKNGSQKVSAYIRKGTFYMNLNEQDLKKVKSLHVMLKMPVWILEKETNKVLKSYKSVYKHPISYEFKERNISEEVVQFYSGMLNEIFLCLWYKDVKIVIGAFRVNNVTRADFSHVYNNLMKESKKILKENECWEYYVSLPVYPLGDIRDCLILLGFLFDMDLEDVYSKGLHEQVAQNQLELVRKPSEDTVYDTFRVERYTFDYENKIMNLVSQGDIELLKSGLVELGTSVLPILTSSSLKTEKNYTIIILEKLASLAIQVGKDILSVIKLRNYYIRKLEEQTEFIGVLATRDSAIIHFTKELHGVSNQARTSLIRCILQYINLKIYDNIKVAELAKQFYLSESALRSRFKEEIGVSINEYVNQRKIEESKMMIQSGVPRGEIARRLSFYDLSHYYRTFKKYTGVTPQQFRDTNIVV